MFASVITREVKAENKMTEYLQEPWRGVGQQIQVRIYQLISETGLYPESHNGPVALKVNQQHDLGTFQKCTFSGPTPELLHQRLWAGVQQSEF